MEAGRKRLAGDTAREANTGEVQGLRREARDLKEVVAEQALQFLELSSPHATVLLAPTIKGLFRDPNFPDRIYTRHSLTDKNLNLSLLPDNLFRFVAFVCDL